MLSLWRICYLWEDIWQSKNMHAHTHTSWNLLITFTQCCYCQICRNLEKKPASLFHCDLWTQSFFKCSFQDVRNINIGIMYIHFPCSSVPDRSCLCVFCRTFWTRAAVQRSRAICTWRSPDASPGKNSTCSYDDRDSTVLLKEHPR